jgi:hypothetical protein
MAGILEHSRRFVDIHLAGIRFLRLVIVFAVAFAGSPEFPSFANERCG